MFFYDINIPSSHGYICQKRFFDKTYTSRLHWHGFVEVEFFIEGTGTHQHGEIKEPIKRGDIWVLSTYDSHQLVIDKGMRSVNIAIEPDILHKKLLNQLTLTHPLHCTLNEEEIQHFISKVDILCHEQQHRELLSRVKANATINDMLVDIVRKSSPDTMPINNRIVHDMIDYLQANYKKNISLVELAREFSLTPNYCGHLFKKIMGITYNDYLNNLRLKTACKALLSSNASIKEIAADSGFNSLEYFYTTFKKFYGVTPAKYRSLTPLQMTNSWKTKATQKLN